MEYKNKSKKRKIYTDKYRNNIKKEKVWINSIKLIYIINNIFEYIQNNNIIKKKTFFKI